MTRFIILTRWLKLTVYVHNHTKGFNSDMWAYSLAMHTLGIKHIRLASLMVRDHAEITPR